MRLEGVIHCDGPDCECHQHVGVPSMAASRLPAGWIKVIEMGDQDPATFAFCGWDCVLRRAGRMDPEEVIEE